MKILFITPFFHPHKGGAEKYAEELFAHLIEKHPDISVDILCYNTNQAPETEIYKNLRIFRVPCWDIVKGQFYLPNPLDLLSILDKLKENKYDLIGTQTRFFDAAWWTWIYARLIKAKSFFIEHGTGFVSHQDPLVRFAAQCIDLTLARLSLKMYDRVVVISKKTQEFTATQLGIPYSKLIYGGVDTTLFKRLENEQRFEFFKEKTGIDLPENIITIGYLGRLIEAKGIFVLYEAFKQLTINHQQLPITLLFVGSGPKESELEEKIEKDNLNDKVKLLGELPYEETIKFFGSIDIFVNPSFNEGLPRTLLEATAVGNIVIATNVGSTYEIVQDNETGFLIEPNDQEALTNVLAKVVQNMDGYKEMRLKAQEHTRQTFDWSHIVEQFYNEIVSIK